MIIPGERPGRLCLLHRKGVSVDTPPFWCPDCDRCDAKKAAGIVRGDEGSPGRSTYARGERYLGQQAHAAVKLARSKR